MTDTRIGTAIAGYRVQEVIGRGGSGIVYRAADPRLDRVVALKVVALDHAELLHVRERFHREATVAASLEHPHVVPLYDAGEFGDLLYLAMRYVPGPSLAAHLVAHGPLDLTQTAVIITAVGEALDAAHARGLVHRDVKPSNILLAPSSGRRLPYHVYLADFGLSRPVLAGDAGTETGDLVGTLDYIAPELIQGMPATGATDEYALGCVMFECLAGKPPFPRTPDAAVLFAHLTDPPPSLAAAVPTEVLGGAEAILARAMAKQPADRFVSCHDLGVALSSLAFGVPVTVPNRGSVPAELVADGAIPSLLDADPDHPDEDLPEHLRPSHGPWRRRSVMLPAIVAMIAVALITAAFIARTTAQTATTQTGDSGVTLLNADNGRELASRLVGTGPCQVTTGPDGSVYVTAAGSRTISKVAARGRTITTEQVAGVITRPSAVAYGGGSVWVASRFEGFVERHDPTSLQPLGRVDLGAGLSGLAVDEGTGLLYVSNRVSGMITAIELSSGRRTGTDIAVGGAPEQVALTSSGLWTIDQLASSVTSVEPETGRVRSRTVLPDAPTALAATEEAIWVTSSLGEVVTRLDPANGAIRATIVLDDRPGPVIATSTSVWVGEQEPAELVRIDVATNTVSWRTKLRLTPTALSRTADSVWVALGVPS